MMIFSAVWSAIKGLTGFGETISSITKSLTDAKVASINAKTEQERIAANERVSALTLRREVLLGEVQHSKANIFMRVFLAAPVGILLWKLFVYDKALGQWTSGHTDSIPAEWWTVIQIVLGFYFLYELVKR